MANLTTRTELNATPADGDLVHIVDVSDTTDNAAGSSKKITRANLVGGLQATPAEGAFVDGDKTKLDGIEASADVTDTANVTAAGALMDSEVDADIKTLSLPANTTISAFGATLVDDADAATARTTLGAGTSNVAAIDDLSDVDTDKSKTPADGDVLTFDGTDWNAEAAAAGGGGHSAQLVYSISALHDMITGTSAVVEANSGTSSAITYSANGYYTFESGTSSTGYARINIKNNTNTTNDYPFWDSNVTMSVKMGTSFNSNTGDGKLGVMVGGYGFANYTGKHIGFKFVHSGAALTIYATSGTGTEETTDITSAFTTTDNLNHRHFLSAVHTAGTDVKFYVDGALVATHTTQVPSGDLSDATSLANVDTDNDGRTTSQDIRLNEFTITQDMY